MYYHLIQCIIFSQTYQIKFKKKKVQHNPSAGCFAKPWFETIWLEAGDLLLTGTFFSQRLSFFCPSFNQGSSGVFLSFQEQLRALNGECLCACPYDCDSVEINQLWFFLAWKTSWASALKHPFCQGFWVLWRSLQSHVRNYFLDINIFTLFQLAETQLRCRVRKEKTN